MDSEKRKDQIMVTIYEADRIEAPRVSTRPLTMVVIAWPSSQDHQPVGPPAELREPIDLHAEEEPTWEDAAWV